MSQDKKRVLFMGTPSYATTILKALIERDDFDLVALITQPDKPVGRKQILTPPDTKAYLLEKASTIPIYQPTTLKSDEAFRTIEGFKPDFIVVAAYGMILPKEILNIAPCINLHASLLPKYRGASPIQEAILNGDRYSGVTAMLMEEGLDSGDILAFSVVDIGGMDAPTLFDELSILAANLTIKVLRNFDKIEPLKQRGEISYCKKIKKSDALVDLSDAVRLYRRYLAFKFWPGVQLESGLKLKEIELIDDKDKQIAGKVLKIDDEGVVVGCQRGAIKLKRVQAPSKKEIDARSYIRGKRLELGDTLI